MKLKKTNEIVCPRNNCEKKEVITAIETGATTVLMVLESTRCCGECGCRGKIQELLDRHVKQTL